MNLIFEFLSDYILSFSEVVVWCNLFRKNEILKKYKTHLLIVLLTLFTFLNYKYSPTLIKGVGTIIIAIFFCKYIMSDDIKKCIVAVFIGEILIILSEAILVLLCNMVFNLKMSNITTSLKLQIIFDCFIGLITIIISKVRIFSCICNFFYKITLNINVKKFILFISFTVFGITSVFASTYFQNNVKIAVTINILISIIYVIITVVILNYQNRYYRIKLKYNTSLDSLQSQENVINEYRIMNHENKNQLLTIVSMTKDEKVKKYVNSLINHNNKLNNEIMDMTLKLPEGGIRGLIYNKLLNMKEKDISFNLNIDKLITNKLLSIIDDNDIVDICEIVGVFIDNAIDETCNIKEKFINIDMHVADNNMYIIIKNNHEIQNIESKNILKSNKGKDRGYGLQLVKKIVDSNKRLSNKKEITKNVFSQILIIKLKKKI